MMKKTVVTLIAFVMATGMISAMQRDTLVQYTPDFKFRDGIYLNFDMVKTNNPIPKAKLFTSVDYNDKDFFDQVISSEKIYFYDNMGIRQEIDKDAIWGFARNGVLYVKVQDTFNRITFFGSIIHFVADVTTTSPDIILTVIMIRTTRPTGHTTHLIITVPIHQGTMILTTAVIPTATTHHGLTCRCS